jgi:Fe-S-cluster-containing dehydrogenase component
MSSLTDPPIDPGPGHGPRYWKTLTELADGADSVGSSDEFPTPHDQTIDPLSRRGFFRLMGASMALAGVAGPGCQRYEREEIVPLARRPEDQVPGVPLQYASVFELAGWGQPLVVSSYEGRPIHVDGNPDHPFTGDGYSDKSTHRHAGSTPFAQASVLNVYDQDRSKSPVQRGKGATFDDFKNWVAQARNAMKADAGSVRFLSESMSSPTLAQLKRALLAQLPGAQWHEWEPISFDNERAGTKLAFGRPLRTFAHLDKAETIVTLDGDLFLEHPAAMRYAKDWKRSRDVVSGSLGAGKMNRLWSVESTFTQTGSVADHRLPIRSELILPFVSALDVAISGGGTQPSAEFLKEAKVAKFLRVLATELKANHGRAVVIAGRRQPPLVHALVAKINDAIGATGATLDYLDDGDDRPTHAESITKLAADIKDKRVKHLFILGGNPVYDAPADLDFGSLVASVENSVHLSEWEDETSDKCGWHVPRANYLECWGDARTWDGTWTIQQPLIMPLYGGISAIELASLIAGEEKPGEALVRAAVEGSGGGAAWRKSVHDGFVANTAIPPTTAQLQPMPVFQLSATQLGGSRLKNGSLEVVYHVSSNTWDGRFANNAWLQETPDFFTKVVWDNYALVGPATAQDLGVANDTKITVKVDGRELTIPCYVMPGQAMGSIGLVLGGGRTKAGSKGGTSVDTSVGFNVYAVRSSKALDFASGAAVTGGGGTYKLSGTQEHWDIRNGIDKSLFNFDEGGNGTAERLPELVREVDKTTFLEGENGKPWDARGEGSEFWKDPNGRNYSLFQEKTYEGRRWGMAIDLGSCVSCNACMVACQSENNIPVVGKEQVANNREMHWIRIDRYFEGSPDDPRIVNQPLTCQQCENAPCEQVCPVGATMHSSEGLNDMVYNRCVGTRYCLNNCPYRVRRFNFLDWNKEFKEARNRVRKLVMNPEVTVRHRGVMEKCTYCVQRIQNHKIKAKNERRDLVDGEITTACQDACPTQAIVFGDLADKDSWVSRLQNDHRSYELLGQLNTKPRTQYLARVRNPNPELG